MFLNNKELLKARSMFGGGGSGGGGGGGGGASVAEKDVNFYDYDGTVLYAYTVEEAQALTELPALPEREGLICQGWNWSLEDIKAHNRAVDVGAMYITDDGKTRIYITLPEGRTSPMLGCCPNGTVTVDWGDGTEPDVLTGTSTTTVRRTLNHTYASAGDYVISLTVDGEMGFYGNNSDTEGPDILRYSPYGSYINRAYQNAIKKIEIGGGVTSIGAYAFYYCHNLTTVTIPNGVTSISNLAFYNCHHLTTVTIPNGVTSIGGSMFQDCYDLKSFTIPNSVTSIGEAVFHSCADLKSFTIPNGVTSIGKSTFYNCRNLTTVTIPNGVTSIGESVFYGCYGLRYVDFSHHTAVPTLTDYRAFTKNVPGDCKIRVPAALYDEWKAATNWSSLTSMIVAV